MSKPLKVSEDILPLGEFRSRASRIIKELAEHQHPLVITQNGRPACVVLAPEAFDRMRGQQDFLDAVAEGLEDVRAGRVIDDSALGDELDAEFGALAK